MKTPRGVATTVAALGALLGFAAPAANAAVAARGTLAGSGTSYSLRVVNTGDVSLDRMTFAAASSVEITGSDGPGGSTGSTSNSFARSRISIAPGATGVFAFTTSAPYPPGAGGTLTVAAVTGPFVRAVVTGPPPPPAPPPRPSPARLPSLLPPLGSGDADGDSTRDAADLCPTTSTRFRAVLKGCSLVDFIVSPAALLEDAKSSLSSARRLLRSPKRLRKRMRGPNKLMARGLRRLEGAGAKLAVNPCLASRKGRSALRVATRGGHKIAKLLTRGQKSVVHTARRFYRKHPRAGGDSDAFSVRYYGLAIERAQTRSALAHVARLRRLMGKACKAKTRQRKVRARVVGLEAGGTVAKLAGGTTLVLGAARKVRGLDRGVTVEARGTGLRGDVIVARDAIARSIKINPDVVPCAFKVKVAPVQDFAKSNADILYYDARGYTGGFGTYALERGMGIGADRGAACTKKDAYFMSVFLDYSNTSKQKVTKLIGILNGVSGEEPAKIPNDVDPKQLAKLRFEVYGIDCIAQGCMGEQLETKSEKFALIKKKGAWGSAVYTRTLFSIEDGSKTDFDTAILVSHKASSLPGSTVFGVGYGIKGNKSTYPTRQFIVLDDKFAVHDDVPTAKNPGGLLWAYITGSRNGYPYYYVARLPHLVTDVVRYCPGTDSFYRLPWKAGTAEKVTQGNNTTGTHKGGQKYAFDFTMPSGTKGYAPRGGVVDFLVESRTATSNPKNGDPWVPGNVLRIKHLDGTFSWYEHMQKNGVYPKQGHLVTRGDEVVTTDNTGNSTGPHLHYHVTTVQGADDASGNNSSRGGTIPILFQLQLGAVIGVNAVNFGIQLDCVAPDKNEGNTVFFSTNAHH